MSPPEADSATAGRYVVAGHHFPRPAISLGIRERRIAADAQQDALVLIAVLIVLGANEGALHVPTTAVVVATVWFVALGSVCHSVRYPMLSLGSGVCSLMGTALGLAAVSLLGFWLPVLRLTPAQLALASVAVFVASVVALWMRTKLEPPRRVLVVGASGVVERLLAQLAAHPALPFECVGVVDEDERGVGAAPWLGRTSDLDCVVRREQPDLVVVEDRPSRAEAVDRLLDAASLDFRMMGIHDFYEYAFGRVPVDHLSPVWFMSVLHLYQRPYPRATKRLLDLAVAGSMLVIAAPILLVVACLVRVSSSGPVLFRQIRCGEGGRPFEIVKFRTMRVDAEASATPVWAAEADPRVTRVGRTLRKLRLDELPQLWNVLRGDMSIVGPRPERPEFLTLLEKTVPFWSRRHLVKPGITGWAQIRRGYAADAEAAADKLSYDLYYLRHRSLALDLAIMLKTARVVVSGLGAR
jgi:exopolysaccharide biosynthesis polyprenyl glycosylphosphotransferase